MRHADAAMYAASRQAAARNFRFHHGRARDRPALASRMRLDHAMRQALAQRPLPPALPAAGRPAHRRDRRRRGADPLARPRARATSRPASSSRWPRRAASSSRSATGCCSAGRRARPRLWQRPGCALPVAVNVSALQFQQAELRRPRRAGVLRGRRLAAAPARARAHRVDPGAATPTRRCSACRRWRGWACSCRSTTSAPATRAWPT